MTSIAPSKKSTPRGSKNGADHSQTLQINEPKRSSKAFTLPTDKHLFSLEKPDDFESIISEAGDRVVMFEFFAAWCGPCKILTTKLMDMAEVYKGKLLIVKIDVDEFEDMAVEHNVTAMPTFLIMQHKKLLKQFASSNAESLQETVETYAGKPEGQGNGKEEKK
ncbi:thioredoxin-2-like [Stomoxys calcitrans]|uniref:thioredoxin-2-like n=1 Tax=Stomoxys calcitrans TaxID=35570 RepID=UPI0027E22A66|nr:thioredoxin-2-like [Stomoxys calcitrans]